MDRSKAKFGVPQVTCRGRNLPPENQGFGRADVAGGEASRWSEATGGFGSVPRHGVDSTGRARERGD